MTHYLKAPTRKALLEALAENGFHFTDEEETYIPKPYDQTYGEHGLCVYLGKIPLHTYDEEGDLIEEKWSDDWCANVKYSQREIKRGHVHQWELDTSEPSNPHNRIM